MIAAGDLVRARIGKHTYTFRVEKVATHGLLLLRSVGQSKTWQVRVDHRRVEKIKS